MAPFKPHPIQVALRALESSADHHRHFERLGRFGEVVGYFILFRARIRLEFGDMGKPADREEQGIRESLCGLDPQWIDSRRCARVDLDEKDEPARRVLAAFGAIDEGRRRKPGIRHEAGRWTESLASQDQLRCASDLRPAWLDLLQNGLCAKRSAKREDSQPAARAVVRHQIPQIP